MFSKACALCRFQLSGPLYSCVVSIVLTVSQLLLTFAPQWFILFISFNFLWPVLYFVRKMAAFLTGKKKLLGIGNHFYSYVCTILVEPDAHVMLVSAESTLQVLWQSWTSSCSFYSSPVN